MQKFACPPALLELLPTTPKIRPRKSEVAPNPQIGPFSHEGQHQIIFRRIMHRGQKHELYAYGEAVLLSWVSLGETVDWFREAYG